MFFLPLIGVAAATAALGVAEARSVVRLDRVVPIGGLPAALDGLRIAHVSDLHLGVPGVNRTAAQRAVALVNAAAPDLVAITGDLLTHPRGTDDLFDLLDLLDAPLGVYVTLGNHDVGDTRDPFSRAGAIPDLSALGVELLRDRTVAITTAGATIAISGLEPRRPDSTPYGLAAGASWPESKADLSLVLAHYPDVFDGAPLDARGLVLTGHLHGGQICMPWPSGRLRLSQLGHRYSEGLYHRGALTMHISRGVGTSFVPLRFFARPEVTILTLRALNPSGG